MSAHRSTKWFWSDWLGDQAVRSLTPAERGLWIDLLALAAVGNPTGYVCDERGEPVPLEQIARLANCTAAEALSLIDGIAAKGAASRDRAGRLFNRRMVRDAELSVKKRRAGQAGGLATSLKWFTNPGVPQHLPQHVPRQTGTRAFSSKNLTSTSRGTARASARSKESANGAEPPAAAPNNRPPSESLQEVMQRKGWIP